MTMHRATLAALATLLALSMGGCDALVSTDQRLERARHALAVGDLGRAEIELAKLIRKAPQNADARLLLARVSLAGGDALEAQVSLERAVAAGARGTEVDSLRVETWLAANQPKALIDALEKKELNLSEPAHSLALARAYIELGESQGAIRASGALLAADPASAQARLLRAEALALSGDSDEALREIGTVIAAQPGSSDAWMLRGRILMFRGQYAAAESSFRLARRYLSSAAVRPQRELLIGAIAEACLAQGKLDNAATSQQELASLLPDALLTRLLGARIKLARGDYLGGIVDLQRLVAEAPEYRPPHMSLGAAELIQGNLMQAEAQLAEVVVASPANIEARKLLARVRLLLQQPDAALRVLTPAVNSGAADAELYGLMGAVQARSGHSGAAIETLEAGVRTHPDSIDFKLNLAEAYLAATRPADAVSILEKLESSAGNPRRDALLIAAVSAQHGPRAARLEVEKLLAARPRSVPTLNVAAEYLTSQWEFERARALLHSALELDPRNTVTLVNLARLNVATGDISQAQVGLASALALDEPSDAVRIALSDLMVRRGAREEAVKLLEAGLARLPTLELQLALARVELHGGDARRGMADLDRVIHTYPNRPDVVNRAGELLLEAGQYDTALARFRRATDLAPGNAAYWLNAGRAQLAMDHPQDARESLSKALTLQADWIPAVAALTLVDLRAGRHESALRRVRELLKKQPANPDLLVLAGDAEAAADRLNEAVSSYASAQRIRPDAATAVKLYRVQRDAALPKPEAPLMQWLALRPADYGVRSILAEYYLATGSFRESAGEFEQVIQEAPANAVALNNLAWVYLQVDDPRAASTAERAYRIAPSSPAIADTLGWILARKGLTGRALELLGRAASNETSEPDIQYHYAFALVQAGRREEAYRILTRLLSGSRPFSARQDAERLLAELRA